jgi:hypothetical protein
VIRADSTLERLRRLAASEPVDRVAQSLQETLGQRIVAYAVGVQQPRHIGEYATGRSPDPPVERRLRGVFLVTRLVLHVDTAETVRAWLIGSDPALDGRAPVELLADDQLDAVLRAAEAFVNRA